MARPEGPPASVHKGPFPLISWHQPRLLQNQIDTPSPLTGPSTTGQSPPATVSGQNNWVLSPQQPATGNTGGAIYNKCAQNLVSLTPHSHPPLQPELSQSPPTAPKSQNTGPTAARPEPPSRGTHTWDRIPIHRPRSPSLATWAPCHPTVRGSHTCDQTRWTPGLSFTCLTSRRPHTWRGRGLSGGKQVPSPCQTRVPRTWSHLYLLPRPPHLRHLPRMGHLPRDKKGHGGVAVHPAPTSRGLLPLNWEDCLVSLCLAQGAWC